MNIIKAVKTANKIQKVKVKAKKGMVLAAKLGIGAAVLGTAALAIHQVRKSKRKAKTKQQLEETTEANKKVAQIEYKKKKKMAKLEHKKNVVHGTTNNNAIHDETVHI